MALMAVLMTILEIAKLTIPFAIWSIANSLETIAKKYKDQN